MSTKKVLLTILAFAFMFIGLLSLVYAAFTYYKKMSCTTVSQQPVVVEKQVKKVTPTLEPTATPSASPFRKTTPTPIRSVLPRVSPVVSPVVSPAL